MLLIKDRKRLNSLEYGERCVIVDLAFGRLRTTHKMTVQQFNILPSEFRWILTQHKIIAKINNSIGVKEWGTVEFIKEKS